MKRSCFRGCFCSTEVFVGQALPDNAPAKGHLAAFTLIELLVVVLIIGILAAVAVPQYQVAVMKSRYATIKSMVKSIVDAEDVYYLTNGSYTNDFSKLDIDIPAEVSCEISMSTDTQHATCYILDKNGNKYLAYSQRFLRTDVPHRRICMSFTSNLTDLSNKICKSETKRSTPSGDYSVYVSWGYN